MSDSVSCILFNTDKSKVVLIKRRDIPVWVLPGGGIEEGEEPEVAAKREAEEETGLNVAIIRKIAFYTPQNRLTRPTHFYEGVILGGELTTGAETKNIGYFSFNQLPKRLVPFYKTWIDDALLFSPEIFQKKIRKTSYWTFVWYLLTHPFLVIQFLLTRIGIHLNR